MVQNKYEFIEQNIDNLRQELLDDLYFFYYYFYSRINNVTPLIPRPVGRQNHVRIMTSAIMSALRADTESIPGLVLNINVPPRYFKTEVICHAIAWVYAHNARANNIYVSHKKMLAAEKTGKVKGIMESKIYQTLFDARICRDRRARDNFSTIQGGKTIAVGADGSGLGEGAGTSGKEPYGGGLFMDDVMKAQDSCSAAIIASTHRLYSQTLVNRRNDPETTPIIHISQRTSENDLTGLLENGVDDRPIDNYQEQWRQNSIKIAALDKAGNALFPEKHTKEYLLDLKKNDPYTFYSQMQQEPISDSNLIFNTEAFVFMKEEPKIMATFITADTAETADRVNDASVFSMFGIYECEFMGNKTGDLGLHWIACHQVRVEPEELIGEFEYFYSSCLRHSVKPAKIFIEKKSTGAMLLSFLRKRQGLILVDIERNAGSGSKTARFRHTAPFVSKGLVSMNEDCTHRRMCINHFKHITFAATQKHDDIADTLSDGIQIGLIDKSIWDIKNIDSNKSAAANKVALINRQRRNNSSSIYY